MGNLININSVRTNLSPYSSSDDVDLDLAVHDIAILDFLLEKLPVNVLAISNNKYRKGYIDEIFISLEYEGGLTVKINSSWFSPIKTRKLTLIGSKKIILYDDIEINQKLKIYDFDLMKYSDSSLKSVTSFRKYSSPKLLKKEPLSLVIENFLYSIQTRKSPKSDVEMGLRVAKILDCVKKSLKHNNRRIKII